MTIDVTDDPSLIRQMAESGCTGVFVGFETLSNENRADSDFLFWESAYAELLFPDTFWPDFGGADLAAALTDFRQRDRRFGGLTGLSGEAA